MTLQECYEKMHGDYADIMKRLNNEALVSRLLVKFLDSVECADCGNAIKAKDMKHAFMAAHTIKGVALNLSLTELAKSASALTELLRPQQMIDESKTEELYSAMVADYNHVCAVIKEFANK